MFDAHGKAADCILLIYLFRMLRRHFYFSNEKNALPIIIFQYIF